MGAFSHAPVPCFKVPGVVQCVCFVNVPRVREEQAPALLRLQARNPRRQLLPVTVGQLGDVDCANLHNLAGTRDERLPVHVVAARAKCGCRRALALASPEAISVDKAAALQRTQRNPRWQLLPATVG